MKTRFENLKNEIEEIAKNYFACLFKIKSIDSKLSENNNQFSIYKSYLNHVNEAYLKLDDLDKKIINCEFFYQEYPYWWEKQFTLTAFYKLKLNAMEKFIKRFKEV